MAACPDQELQNTKVLYVDWNCYGGQYMKATLVKCGIILSTYSFSPRTNRNDPVFEEKFSIAILSFTPHFVFSFNYFPVISKVCNALEVIYVSWVYDNPLVSLYSYTLANPWNRVFLFDKQEYLFFRKNGINTVFYLPLAAAPERLRSNIVSSNTSRKYQADVSFVGSLYTESKHQLYHHIQTISDYTRGYLDAIMQAQKNIYGLSLIEELLNDDILSELRQACPCHPSRDGVETESYLYSNYFLLRHITAMERTELIQKVAHTYSLQLYTNDKSFNCPGCTNHGAADYYLESPSVFHYSKINLNITLRSIKSGIPLRAFDIIGSKGFLLTNYQDDFPDCFVPDEDFVYYTDADDLINKIDYFLSHEKDRVEILQNGYEKVLKYHTYENRIPVLFNKSLEKGGANNGLFP